MGGGINCIRGPNSFPLRESDLTGEKHLEHNAICCLSLCLHCVRVQSIVLRLQMDAASVWQDFHAGKNAHTFSYEAFSSGTGEAAQLLPRFRSRFNWRGSYRRWSSLVASCLWNLNFRGWRIAKKKSMAGVCLQKAPEVFTCARISSSWTRETSSITSSMLNKQLPVRSAELVKAILHAILFLRPVSLL